MLKLLREIEAPQEFRFTGSWIAAALLNQVSDYKSLISTAHQRIEAMEHTARAQLESERSAVMKTAAESCRDDFDQIAAAFEKRRQELESRFAESCIEVTRLAIDQVIRSVPESHRIEPLVLSLISKVKTRHDVRIKTNPAQQELVEKIVAGGIAEKFGVSSWTVIADPGVVPDRFVVDSHGNSYIDVSLENWLNLLASEIDALHPYFESQCKSTQGRL